MVCFCMDAPGLDIDGEAVWDRSRRAYMNATGDKWPLVHQGMMEMVLMLVM